MDLTRFARVVALLRQELGKHVDVEREILGIDQVGPTRRREAGERFTLRDHARGMILAMLTAQRVWRDVVPHLPGLHRVFGDYEVDFLERADPAALANAVKRLRCGNVTIARQMAAIGPNLAAMRRMEHEFGSVDAFVPSAPPEETVRRLSQAGGRWKLKQIGEPLAQEYLKNVGVRAIKIDVHLARICGSQRLALIDECAPASQSMRLLRAQCDAADVHLEEFDNLVWMLGATRYAEVCTAVPRCANCELRVVCRFPSRTDQLVRSPASD